MDKVVGTGASVEAQKKDFAEKAWLRYFNQVLFEKGLISEAKRNRMISKIEGRKSAERK